MFWYFQKVMIPGGHPVQLLLKKADFIFLWKIVWMLSSAAKLNDFGIGVEWNNIYEETEAEFAVKSAWPTCWKMDEAGTRRL